MTTISMTFDNSGPVPLTAQELRDKITAYAKSQSPGYTDNLPGSLIEDIASTSVGALLTCDAARVEVLNSIGPRTANEFMLNELAAQYGVPTRKDAGLTSVNLEFSGPPGFNVPKGFTVGDGTHQYATEKGIIIPTGGESDPVTAYATTPGVWAVPANTVNKLVTSTPEGINLTVTNPYSGIPAADKETLYDYRARVWEAGMTTVSALPSTIRTALAAVKNVNPRLVSVIRVDDKFVVMCGGGDVFDMAGAIFNSAGDFTKLNGVTLGIEAFGKGTVTTIRTTITHGFSTGEKIKLNGVTSIPDLNGKEFVATVTGPRTFTIPYNSTGKTWNETGYVTPNFRNQLVTISDWPDEYAIPFVIPLEQDVKIEYQWRTDGVNYLTSETILALVKEPTLSYINGLFAGNAINLNTLKDIFLTAVGEVLNRDLFTYLRLVVTIDGVITEPENQTDIIPGDRYSYFYAEDAAVTVRAPS